MDRDTGPSADGPHEAWVGEVTPVEAIPPREEAGYREIGLLGFALLSIGVGQSIVYSVLPPIARELGLPESSLALIHSLPAVIWSLTSPFWGRASDKWGRRIVVVIGFMGWGVSAVLFGFSIQVGLWGLAPLATVYALMLVTRSLFGLVTSGALPAAESYVAERTSAQNRTTAIATLGAAGGVGTIIGPAIGASLVAFGFVAPFYFTAVISIAGALMVWRFLPEAHPVLASGMAEPEGEPRGWPNPFEARLFPFFTVAATSTIANISVMGTLGFYFADILHTDPKTTASYMGYALMVEAGAALAIQLGVIPYFKPSASILMRAGTLLIFAANIVLLAGSTLPHFVASMLIFGAGAGMMGAGGFAAISFVVRQDELGATMGLMGSVGAMAFAVGPVISLPLYELMIYAPYLLNLALLGGTLLLVFLHPTVRRLAEAGR